MTLRRVQRDVMHRFSTIAALLESGRAGAIEIASAQLTVGSTVTDLMETDLSYAVSEAASPTDSGHSTELIGPPVYVAGGGPGGQNAWTLPVVDSSGFTVGDVIKTFNKGFPGGSTYLVLDLPNGTEVQVHAASDQMDIVDSDTIIEVDGTGDYVLSMQFDVDQYLTPQSPTGDLVLVIKTVAVANDPSFTAQSTLTRDFNFELDLTGQAFRTG